MFLCQYHIRMTLNIWFFLQTIGITLPCQLFSGSINNSVTHPLLNFPSRLPWQVAPLNPREQLHTNPPAISVQIPTWLQGLGLHGSLSAKEANVNLTNIASCIPSFKKIHNNAKYRHQYDQSREHNWSQQNLWTMASFYYNKSSGFVFLTIIITSVC